MGERANSIHITAGGSVQWVLNLGAIPTVSIDYRTYELGLDLDATDGTRFYRQPRRPWHVRQHREKVDTF